MSNHDDNLSTELPEQERDVVDSHDPLREDILLSGRLNVRDIYAKNVVIGNQYNYYARITSPHVPQGPLFMAEDLPRDFVARPREFAALKQSLLQEQQQSLTAITSTLVGAGGYGKTTLALALCHDADVRTWFHGGILWVTLGEKPINLVNKINELIYLLQGEYPNINSLEVATTALKNALADRPCLLVIDDVWQVTDLKPFLQGAPQCARLVTTRNHQVLPPITRHVPVDAMSQDEATQLLQAGIETNTASENEQEAIHQLASLLGEWPLLLTLTNGVLRDRVLHLHEPLMAALTYLQQALEKRGVVAFDARNAVKREEAVALTLEVSLLQLDIDERKRYEELAIFPEDVNIPLATVSRFWKATGNFDAFHTEELCQRLANLSLLLRCNLSSRHIQLHDTIRGYLRTRVASHLVAFNKQLLDSYTLVHWADLTQDEEYLWEFLAQHLCQAERWKELHTTFTDVQFLAKKVLVRGVVALEEDLLQSWNAAQAWQKKHEPIPDAATWLTLQSRIRKISHLVSQMNTLSEIGGVLLAHLGCEMDQSGQRQQAKTLFAPPFLTAWHPLPERSSSVLLRTLRGHTNGVTACAFSPDSRRIVSASNDTTLRVWNATSGARLLTLSSHTDKVTACAFSPDGRSIVSASSDKTLKVWDAATGTERLSFIGRSGPSTPIDYMSCAVSPDGRFIVSASADMTYHEKLKIWDAYTGSECLSLGGRTDKVTACAFSPDSHWIASASNDKTLRVWDIASGIERISLSGHTDEVTACAFSPDGRSIVSASKDKTLKVWDVTSEIERLSVIEHFSDEYIPRFSRSAFSPDECWMVHPSSDHTLKVQGIGPNRDAEGFSLIGHSAMIMGCAFSPDGRSIVSADWDGILKIWDASSRVERLSLSGHTNEITACTFSPDGRSIVSAGRDGTLKVWDATSSVERVSLSGHNRRITACAFSSDGRSIVSASDDETLKVWDIASGIERLSLSGHTDDITACAFSSDGRSIVSASDDETLKVWDTTSGTERLSFASNTKRITACAFSPDGHWIVSTSDGKTFKVWDASSGKELLPLAEDHTASIRACAFSADGHSIVSASDDGTLQIWNTASGKVRLTLMSHDRVEKIMWYNGSREKSPRFTLTDLKDLIRMGLAWNATSDKKFPELSGLADEIWNYNILKDEKHALLASLKDMVEMIWEDVRGKKHTEDEWFHTMGIIACAFSPNSRFIITASQVTVSQKGVLRIWNASSRNKYRTLTDHADQINGCAFSPNGRFVVTASEDKTLKIWDVSSGKERLTFTGHTTPATACAFSPNSRFIVSASYDEPLKIWDATSGVECLSLIGHPDEFRSELWSDGSLTHKVNAFAFSPDGRFIVSASDDETLKVWDTTSGVECSSLAGHTSKVNSCAVHPDGRLIVSVSSDSTLKVWDLQKGTCLLTFPVDGELQGCAFHPDGEHLVAWGDQGIFFLLLVQ